MKHSNPLAEPLRELLSIVDQVEDCCMTLRPDCARVLDAATEEAKRELRLADLRDAEEKRKSA